jgi:N-acetylneuraminic acid mutarotase
MSPGLQRIVAVVATASIILIGESVAWAQAGNQPEVQPTPGKWGRLAPIPEKSEEFTFADVNGKIYLFGGLPVGTKPPLGLVQEFDPATDKWTQKKNMPLATHHAAAIGYNGKVYLFGGQAQLQPGGPTQVPIDNSWEYDPAADSWKALAAMPTARTAAVAAEVGGKIYVLGGASVHPGQKIVSLGPTVPHRSLDTNEVYDPAANRWETRMTMPTARNHAGAGVVNGKIYVIGGRVGSSVITTASNTNVVEVYDTVANLWGAAGLRMPTPRSGMGWATYKGKIYIAGGQYYDAHVFAAIRAVEGYDPATNSWTILPTMPTARHGVNVAIIGNRLYAIGGHVQAAGTGGEAANSDVNEVYEFPDK